MPPYVLLLPSSIYCSGMLKESNFEPDSPEKYRMKNNLYPRSPAKNNIRNFLP